MVVVADGGYVSGNVDGFDGWRSYHFFFFFFFFHATLFAEGASGRVPALERRCIR